MIRTLLSLLAGLLVGLGIGLYLGWVQFPAQFANSPASALAPQYKDAYTVMIAGGYLYDGDGLGAIERLRALGVENVPEYVQGVTERFITNSRELCEIQALIALSEGLGRASPIFDQFRATALPGACP
jgi:hypothetical protein